MSTPKPASRGVFTVGRKLTAADILRKTLEVTRNPPPGIPIIGAPKPQPTPDPNFRPRRAQGTQWLHHDKAGSRAAQRRLRQRARDQARGGAR